MSEETDTVTDDDPRDGIPTRDETPWWLPFAVTLVVFLVIYALLTVGT